MGFWSSKDGEHDAEVSDTQDIVKLSATDSDRLRHEIAALRDLAAELARRADTLEQLLLLSPAAPEDPVVELQDRVGPRRSTGTVDRFDQEKGYGFITPDDEGREVFAHFSAIDARGFRNLTAGQRVAFEIIPGPKGPMADHIRVIAGPR